MPPTLRKAAAMLVLAFVVIPFALACCCIIRSDPFGASSVEFRPGGLYSRGDNWTSHHTHGCSLVLQFRYRIGMSRDEIQKNFAFGARLIASDSRPDKDWRAMGSGRPGLAYYVLEFESGLRSGLVAACDVYDDGESHHVLFFDDAGLLIGAQQFPNFCCLSACVEPANEATSGEGAGPLQFAFVSEGRSTEQRR